MNTREVNGGERMRRPTRRGAIVELMECWLACISRLFETQPGLLRIAATFLKRQSNQIADRPNHLRRGQIADSSVQVQPKLTGQNVF
jgi:hypothetical protein